MLLLVVDDKVASAKKTIYEKELPVRGVITVNSILQAERIIERQFSTENISVLISNVLLEDDNIDSAQLLKLSKDFNGAIIAKVPDELSGLNLIRDGVITEFYIANSDSAIELESLKKAYYLANLKKVTDNKILEINENLSALKEIQKSN